MHCSLDFCLPLLDRWSFSSLSSHKVVLFFSLKSQGSALCDVPDDLLAAVVFGWKYQAFYFHDCVLRFSLFMISDDWFFPSFFVIRRISIQHMGLHGTALSAQALVPMSLTHWKVSCTSPLTRSTFFSSELPSSHLLSRNETWESVHSNKCRCSANCNSEQNRWCSTHCGATFE